MGIVAEEGAVVVGVRALELVVVEVLLAFQIRQRSLLPNGRREKPNESRCSTLQQVSSSKLNDES